MAATLLFGPVIANFSQVLWALKVPVDKQSCGNGGRLAHV